MYKMKRSLTLLILLFAATTFFGQWNTNYNIDGKGMSAPSPLSPQYLYDWQSPYLDDYDVKFYWLDINVSDVSTFVSGNVTINADAKVALDTFAFELIPVMTIDSFFIDGTKYSSYTYEGDDALFPVDEIDAGTNFSAKIYYHGDPGSGGFFSGISHGYSGQYGKDVVWTLSEPFSAKEWFPVKQDLEDKADSAWIFLTCDSSLMAGSEGLLTNTVNLGNGKTRYEWKTKYPIDYYLISFAVSDYQVYDIYAHPDAMNGDSILIQNLIYDAPNCLENNKAGIDQTAQFIELYSDLFSLYPFSEEKYGHCLTQLGGGMEHQTMTTIGGFSFHLVSHELGHMWFGDNVTCATWSDIWVNEGFATYSNCLAEEYINGWESGKSFITSAQSSAMSSPGGSIYIPEDQIYEGNEWRIFNGRLSYDKGAVILHMLRHEIQDDSVFFQILKTYQADFTDSTATGDDFKNEAEDVTGMDFDYFFDQWYYGEGYPIYDIEWYNLSGTFFMTATQSTSSSTPLFQMLMDYKLTLEDGSDTTVQFYQTDNVNNFSVYLGKKVIQVIVDPERWTMEKVSNITVGVKESESPVFFTVGPNPVKNNLTVYFANPSVNTRTIFVNDLSGKTLASFSSSDNKTDIDFSLFSKGIYIIRVTDGDHTFIRKIIK